MGMMQKQVAYIHKQEGTKGGEAMMRTTRGFTLIELVMVIVILGILAAVALPTFVNLQDDAKKSACKGSLGGLRSAIAIWYAKSAVLSGTPGYPSVAELRSTPGGPLQFGVPPNPYNSSTKITQGTTETADSTAGWIYNDSLGLLYSAASQTWNSGF